MKVKFKGNETQENYAYKVIDSIDRKKIYF